MAFAIILNETTQIKGPSKGWTATVREVSAYDGCCIVCGDKDHGNPELDCPSFTSKRHEAMSEAIEEAMNFVMLNRRPKKQTAKQVIYKPAPSTPWEA